MRNYVAVVEPSDDGRTWWISFPSLPGITSATDDVTRITQHAREALESARAAGMVLRGAVEDAGIPTFDPSEYESAAGSRPHGGTGIRLTSPGRGCRHSSGRAAAMDGDTLRIPD